MPFPLYLDAARMGRMSPSTQRVLHDFVRYQGENGCTLYFDQFLSQGWQAWSHHFRCQYPALKVWQGIAEFRQALRQVVGAEEQIRVLLASRTAKLVELAARQVFRNSRRVLLTDLTWPAYARIFRRWARRLGGEIVVAAIRQAILAHRATPRQVMEHLARAFLASGCQALFLSHVSHDGICLPLSEIAKDLNHQAGPVHLVVDGAQALAQVPVDLSSGFCDFYVAGAHKWLGAYLPLGIGFCPSNQMNGDVDDPLLHFLESRENSRASETVNLTPLLSGRAALQDLQDMERLFATRRSNRARLIEVLDASWKPLLPDEGFASGVLLLQGVDARLQSLPAEEMRSLFLSQGAALTAYPGGLLRLSMPAVPWTGADLDRLANVFWAVGNRCRACPAVLPGPFLELSAGAMEGGEAR